MKTFTRILVTFAAFVLLASTGAHAQEWNAAQKEVWKNVEAYWALDAAGNLDGFMSYFHDNYIGWEISQPMPGNKATARKFIEHDYKTEKTILYNITPVSINVFGNVAIANYYYVRIAKNAEGKENTRSGRWADVLMKQGDKWVLIGDHGGRTSKDED
ncbi:MAG: nuclear transport factor 2 family protein [Bacteroidetes bacterium]|nr:nuclear transport factor 2 family protein [Bacteroidota bacterium]MCW5894536.1 nuclear transport factor 2 family protein [Bacteroidota bacterium]